MVLSASSGPIKLDVISFTKVHNLSISMTIPFKCSSECISLLSEHNPCDTTNPHNHAEASALAFALFSLVKEKLMGSPLEVARCKVDHVVCQGHGNDFVISWNTQGSISALQKTIGVVLKFLRPSSLYTKYTYNVRMLGVKPDRAEFSYLANLMIDSLKSIHFVAIGKIKADINIKDIVSKVANKFGKCEKESGGKAPTKHPEHEHANVLDCSSGANSIIVRDYIQHQGFGIRINGKYLYIYAGNWGSKQVALHNKDRVTAYVSSKYKKLEKFACTYLAYSANGSALGAGHDVLALVKKDDLVSTIMKCIA